VAAAVGGAPATSGGLAAGAELLPNAGPDAQGSTEATRSTAPIVRSLSALVNQRGGVMTMRLDPPELGQLRIQMHLGRGVVSADFHAATAPARALLEKHLSVLRSALEAQGLTVERLSVHVTTSGTNAAGAEAQDQGGAGAETDRDAAGEESRGRGRNSDRDAARAGGASFEDLVADARTDESDPPKTETS
jgi:flagellar hook-length control protein FliK